MRVDVAFDIVGKPLAVEFADVDPDDVTGPVVHANEDQAAAGVGKGNSCFSAVLDQGQALLEFHPLAFVARDDGLGLLWGHSCTSNSGSGLGRTSWSKSIVDGRRTPGNN